MSDVEIHVGDGLEDMGRRFIDAWRRAEADPEAAPERHLSFESFEALSRMLTPRRLELLRAVHANPTPSVSALARRLRRDYKRVHEDVSVLEDAGLISRQTPGVLSAPYDAIRTEIAL